MAGGTWNVWPGIKTAWDAASLDAAFTSRWTATSSDHIPLQQDEAAAGTPFPYCVVRQEGGTPVVKSSHASDTSQVTIIESTLFEFEIHSDSKEEAGTLAALVAAAFEDGTALTISGSCAVDVRRRQDSCQRLDDASWVWFVPVEVWYER